MMNFWISNQPENDWNNGFDGLNMPWYALYDYVEYWEYVHGDTSDHPFRMSWRDDFNSFDDSRWFKKDDWTFPGNACTFRET